MVHHGSSLQLKYFCLSDTCVSLSALQTFVTTSIKTLQVLCLRQVTVIPYSNLVCIEIEGTPRDVLRTIWDKNYTFKPSTYSNSRRLVIGVKSMCIIFLVSKQNSF